MKEVQTIKKIKVKRKQAKSSNYVWIESKKPHQSNCEHGDIVTFTQAKKYEPHLHKVTFFIQPFIEHMFLWYTIYKYA